MSDKIQLEDKIVNIKDLKWILKALLKGWYLLLVVPLLVGVFGAFISYKKHTIYTTQTQILLGDNDIYDYQSSIYRSVGYQYVDISNQLRVLKSYDLIKQAIDKIDVDVTYYLVGRINTTEVFMGTPFKIILNSFDARLANQRLKFNIIDKDQFQIEFELDGELVQLKHYFGEKVINRFYSIQVDEVFDVTLATADYEVQFHSSDYWVNKVLSSMVVENQDYTSILKLSLVDEIPSRSKMFLDSIAKVYIDYTLENEININDNTLTFIDRQIGSVVELMDSISFEIDTLRLEKDILDLDRETDVYYGELFNKKNKMIGLKSRNKNLEHLKEYVESSTSNESLLPPSSYVGASDEYLSSSLAQFYSKQLAKINLSKQVKPDHKGYVELIEGIALQRKDLLIYIDNSISANNLNIEDIDKELKALEDVIKKIPKTSREIEGVNRILNVNQKMYQFLL